MSKRSLLELIVPQHWGKDGSGNQQVRYLQSVDDLVNRSVVNRGTASTNATAVNCTGQIQSTGIGTPQALQPKRYAELTVKARVTFNLNTNGVAYIYAYRTLGAIPTNGAPPNIGDVVVGGDTFVGGPMQVNVNNSGSFSFLDTGLDVTKSYTYYLAVSATNGAILNLINASQILVMERS